MKVIIKDKDAEVTKTLKADVDIAGLNFKQGVKFYPDIQKTTFAVLQALRNQSKEKLLQQRCSGVNKYSLNK